MNARHFSLGAVVLLLTRIVGSSLQTACSGTRADYRFEAPPDDSRVYRFTDSGPSGLDAEVEGDGWFVTSSLVAPYAGVGQLALSAFHSTCIARIPLPANEQPPSAFTIEFFFRPVVSPDAYEGPGIHERRAILTRLDSAPERNGVAWSFEYEPCTGRVLATLNYEGQRGGGWRLGLQLYRHADQSGRLPLSLGRCLRKAAHVLQVHG